MKCIWRPALLSSLLISACGGTPSGNDAGVVDGSTRDSGPSVDAGCGDGCEIFAEVALEPNLDIDILFVVDDSGTMQQEQSNLAASFPAFIARLESQFATRPNLHIGVISTNMGVLGQPYPIQNCEGVGDNGALLSSPNGACTPPDGAFIVDIEDGAGGRTINYPADALSETFSCIAQLGIQGCGFEQPLEAIKRALDGTNSERNAGFIRPDALLGIVILSDEDDCSATDGAVFNTDPALDTIDSELGPLNSYRCFEFGVQCAEDDDPRAIGARTECAPRFDSTRIRSPQSYRDFLLTMKANSSMLLVKSINGSPTPVTVSEPDADRRVLDASCVSAGGEAQPGIRLNWLADSFGPRGSHASICDPIGDGLVGFAEDIRDVASANGCLSAPPADGVGCDVFEVEAPGTTGEVAHPVPACDQPDDPQSSSSLPCYVLEAADIDCGTDRWRLRLHHQDNSPAVGAVARLACPM